MPAADPSGRKWQLTFNNPHDHGWTHERIKEVLATYPHISYWCMADEIGGEEKTYHTHLFFNLEPSTTKFSSVKKKFPTAHIERVKGSSAENRDYVLKDGKWKDTEKGTTSVPGTFEEFGECPDDGHQGKSREADKILDLLKDGASNLEVIEAVPSAMKIIDKVERTRSILRDNQFASEWRNLEVTYIFGRTGLGKTRSVMDKFGYQNCYRVTDYQHPFDTYDGQDVLIFEEFRSGLKHGDMLNYLDGYPLLLPCRYFNRQACFTKVFIISNLAPDLQYPGIDTPSREAFFRRIHKVQEFREKGVQEWTMDKFLKRFDWVKDIESASSIP